MRGKIRLWILDVSSLGSLSNDLGSLEFYRSLIPAVDLKIQATSKRRDTAKRSVTRSQDGFAFSEKTAHRQEWEFRGTPALESSHKPSHFGQTGQQQAC